MARPAGQSWAEEEKAFATLDNLRDYCLRRYKNFFGTMWREVYVVKLFGYDAPLEPGFDEQDREYLKKVRTALESVRQATSHLSAALEAARRLEVEARAALTSADDDVALQYAGVPYLSRVLSEFPSSFPNVIGDDNLTDRAQVFRNAHLVAHGRAFSNRELAWIGILARVKVTILRADEKRRPARGRRSADRIRDVIERERNNYAAIRRRLAAK